MSTLDWNTIYLTCFGIGLVLSVIAFIGGLGHLHIGHWHLGDLKPGHTHIGTTAHAISPVNGFTLVAFLCAFGGSGYLLHHNSPLVSAFVLMLATLSGLAGASLIFWFLTKVLLPMERPLLPADTEMAGVTGKLSGAIPIDGVGELLYSQNGARRSAPVRADDGSTIERGAIVIVMRYDRGIAYVRRWDDFEADLFRDSSPPSIAHTAND